MNSTTFLYLRRTGEIQDRFDPIMQKDMRVKVYEVLRIEGCRLTHLRNRGLIYASEFGILRQQGVCFLIFKNGLSADHYAKRIAEAA